MALSGPGHWAGAALLVLAACSGGAGGAGGADTECLLSLRIDGFMKQAGIT